MARLDVLEQIHEQISNGDLLQQSQTEGKPAVADEVAETHVDTFLKEAVSSRNRITVLRLEQEIERFARISNEQDLLLKPMQSSYERLAAHRIAEYYGLKSMVVTAVFPKVSRIVLVKTVETRLPSIRLADLPVESGLAVKPASVKNEKIAIKQREGKVLDCEESNGASESGIMLLKTMEEREEEYDKARARIFNSDDVASSDNIESGIAIRAEQQRSFASTPPSSGLILHSEGKGQLTTFNRVAIFRDREKDMKDPDYDRSYKRYPQLLDPNACISFPALQKVYSPTSPYDSYTHVDGQWVPQLQLQLKYMPALHFRGPRVGSSYPDFAYMQFSQSHSDSYWQFQRFPPHPHNAQFKHLEDSFCFSSQNGFQSATSLGALGQ